MYFFILLLVFGISAKYDGSAFLGFDQARGNTDKTSASLTTEVKKSFNKSSLLFTNNFFYSKTNSTKDGQKLDSLLKYSLDLGKEGSWFNFYQTLYEHDYFADIDYRITPSIGFGYHIYKRDDFIWDLDAGLGYRVTRYIINNESEDEEFTSILHTFIKKKVFSSTFISEDLTSYPAIDSDFNISFKSISTLSNSLSSSLDLELKYIINYNSDPSEDKKTTDTQLLVGIKYSF